MGDKRNLLLGCGVLSVDAVDIGFTEGGVTIGKAQEAFKFYGDQKFGVRRNVATNMEMTVATNFYEGTLANLKIAWNEPSPITNPVPTQARMGMGFQKEIPIHEITFVGVAPSDPGTLLTRTFTFWECQVLTPGAVKYSRTEGTMIPVEFSVLASDDHDDDEAFGEIIDEL